MIAGAVGLALLVALPFVFELLAPDPAATPSPPSEPAAGALPAAPTGMGLVGRLVYVGVDPADSGVPRLVALDLSNGTYQVGPEIRLSDRSARLVAVGPGGRWLLLIHRVPEEPAYVAELIRDLTEEPREVARGGELQPSPDGQELLVTDPLDEGARRCPGPSDLAPWGVRILRLANATGRTSTVVRASPACDGVFGAVWYGRDDLLLNVSRHRSVDVDIVRGGERDDLFRGVVAQTSNGRYAFALRGSELLVWPGGGSLRPIVTGARTRGRVVAASPGGRYVIVDGVIRGEQGLFVVDVAAGTIEVHPRSLPPTSRIFATAVATDGTLYLVGFDGILAARGATVNPLLLPLGAPEPVVGPVAWLA
jgi:hypothetical protein